MPHDTMPACAYRPGELWIGQTKGEPPSPVKSKFIHFLEKSLLCHLSYLFINSNQKR